VVSGGPLFLPGLRPLWRADRSLQLGRDPDNSVVLDGIDTATAKALIALDGERSEDEVLAAAAADGVDSGILARLISGLRGRGFVIDGETTKMTDLGGPDIAERLQPDCVSVGLTRPGRQPIGTVHRRRARLVALHGGDRVGAPVAALLAAAGIGRLAVVDRERARPCDANPAGVAAGDAFEPRIDAVRNAVLRAAPEAEVGPLLPGQRPDLAVLAGTEPVSMELRSGLHQLGVPHLAVQIRDASAVVGPLVVPGRSACLTCADLVRRDQDPAWPVIVAQLAVRRRREREPGDVVLATMAASMAAMQALELLDGGQPATVGGTLEIRPPDPRVRRRSWPAHPLCECAAADLGSSVQDAAELTLYGVDGTSSADPDRGATESKTPRLAV
jgi:bacteriocin biosynthesis cyclodehydratase domain-containing protein